MPDALDKSKTTRRLILGLAALMVLAGAAFWASDLTSDPPMYYTGFGQSLTTDASQYVFHARNKVLFGDWDPFDHPRWTVYQHSLTSFAAWLWFSTVGVSQAKANAVGLILSLGGLVFLLLGLARHHRPWVPAATAFCFVINVSLLTYGRLSYLENGLILLAGLTFFAWSRWGHRVWGVALCGVLLAFATFLGKLFGALLVPALLAAVLLTRTENRWRHAVASLAAYLVSSALLVLLLYGSDFTAAFTYVGEQSYGLRGFPEGLSSPWGFFEHLIGFGFQNRMYYLGPDLFMFVLVTGTGLLLFADRNRLAALPRTGVLLLTWAAFLVLGLAPLNYSPLRYALFLMPALIAAAFVTVEMLLNTKSTPVVPQSWLRKVLLIAMAWFAVYHIVGNVFYFNATPYRILTWASLPAAVALGLIAGTLLDRWRPRLRRRHFVGLLIVMLALSATANGFRIRRYHYLDHAYSIAEANEDLAAILGPDAVVSGPCGPVLTLDTDLSAFIHLFGVASVDSTLFDRQPITHIAVDQSNLDEARKHYPRMKDAQTVASYWIRDNLITLIDVSQVFGNPRARAYQPSAYERAKRHVLENRFDSALVAIDEHLQQSPATKSALLLKSDILVRQRQLQPALQLMTGLAERYRTDFYVQMTTGRLSLLAGYMTRNRALVDQARQYFERGIAVNRFKTDLATSMVNEVMQTVGGQQPGAAGP